MNKDEWATSSDTLKMLNHLYDRGSGRKFRLFAVACARDDLASGGAAEEFGQDLPLYEREIKNSEIIADGGRADSMCLFLINMPSSDFEIALSVLGYDNDVGLWTSGDVESTVAEVTKRYSTHPAHYLRDIFGDIHKPWSFDATNKTPDVLALANEIYNERRLPIGHLDLNKLSRLADALEESKCNNDELLTHLRSEGPHVRGCWALDLILEKH